MKTIITSILFLVLMMSCAQDINDHFRQQKEFMELKTGICMSYVEAGNLNGAPILLLHGYTDTSRSFQLVIQNLTRLNNNLHIIAPDMRGHGDTSMPVDPQCNETPQACFTPKQMAEDIIALMDALCIDNVYVVGHSMGGVVGQALALEYPKRIQRLVLLSTFANGKACDAIQNFLIRDLIESNWKCEIERTGVKWPQQVYSLTPKDLGEKAADYIKENWVVEPGAAKDFLDAILPETLTTPLGTWIGAIMALGEIDYTSALENLKIPTLIVWSEKDELVSYTDQQLLKDACGAAVRQHRTPVFYKMYGKETSLKHSNPIPDVGHNLHWAAPKEIANDINAFISQAGILTDSCVSFNHHRGSVTGRLK